MKIMISGLSIHQSKSYTNRIVRCHNNHSR